MSRYPPACEGCPLNPGSKDYNGRSTGLAPIGTLGLNHIEIRDWPSRHYEDMNEVRMPHVIDRIYLVNCYTINDSPPTLSEQKHCARRWLLPELRRAALEETRGRTIHVWMIGKMVARALLSSRKYGTYYEILMGNRLEHERGIGVLAARLARWCAPTMRLCKGCGNQIEQGQKCSKCMSNKKKRSRSRKKTLKELTSELGGDYGWGPG